MSGLALTFTIALATLLAVLLAGIAGRAIDRKLKKVGM